MTGTWVSVGAVRVKAISARAPVIQDAVVTGHDKEEVGLLVFPNEAGCRVPRAPASATLATLIADPRVRARMAEALKKMAAKRWQLVVRPARC